MELHRQVGVGIVVTSGNTLAWNAKYVGSIPTLSTIVPIFITPMTISSICLMGQQYEVPMSVHCHKPVSTPVMTLDVARILKLQQTKVKENTPKTSILFIISRGVRAVISR